MAADSSANSGHCGDDLTSSKSTVSTEDSLQPRRRDSLEDAIAAIQSANAFFDGSSLITKSWDRPDVGTALHRRQKHPFVDVMNENRTPSRPVPVKGARRRQELSQEEHFGQWREHDEPDVRYLKSLYERRTWDMWIRITESRKKIGNRGEVPGEGPSMLGMEPELIQTQPTQSCMSPQDEMIFSCDLE